MSSSFDVIELNSRLLALCVQISASLTPGDPAHVQAEILAEIQAVREAFQPAKTQALTATFNRYLRLIGLYLAPKAQTALDALLADTPRNPATSHCWP